MKKFTTALLFMLAFCAGVRAQDCSPGSPPYYLDFESASLPSLPECTTGDAGWTTIAAPGYGFDNNTLQYTGTSETADDWFFTKGVQLTAGQAYKISFKYGNDTASATGQLQVAYGQGANAGAMTSTVTTLSSITGASAATASYGPVYIGASGTYYFGFHATSAVGQGNLLVDDIVIEPWVCNNVTGLTVTDITNTSAGISWDAVTTGNTVQFYQYCFVSGTGVAVAGPTTGATTGSSYMPLIPGTTYTAYVRTFCSGTWGDWVGTTFTTTGCAPVTNLTVSDITPTSANISWDAVTGGTTVYFYQYYFAEEGNEPNSGPTTTTNSGSSTTFMPLTPGTNYTAFVRTFCSGGVWGDWVSVNFSTLSCDPEAVPYSIDFESVNTPGLPLCTAANGGWTTVSVPGYGFDDNALQYTGTSETADAWFFTKSIQHTEGQGYKITFKYGNDNASATGQLQVAFGQGADAGSMTGNITTLNSITGASAATASVGPVYLGSSGNYYFGFHAISEADQGNLLVDDILIEPWTCNTVTGVTVSGITNTVANISWDAVTTGNTVQFYQYTFVLGTAAATAGPITGATTGSSYETLIPGTTYTAYVRTFCSGTWGEWVGSTFTTTGCAPVTNLAVTDVSSSGATISWDAVTGGNTVQFYQYYFVANDGPPSDGPITTTTSASNYFPLSPSSNYTAYVRTFCSGTWGAWVSVNFNTLSCQPVSNLSSSPSSSDTVTLSWAAPAGTVASYTYAYSDTNDVETAITDITTDTSINISGLTPGGTYYFWVKTNCDNDNSSDWVSVSESLTYCTPQPYSQDGIGITNFTLDAINNTTGSESGYYGDYTSLSAEISQGVTKNFSITYGTGYTYGTKIWIDWNNDYDFDDDGEQMYYALSAWTNPSTLYGTITVPIDASLGAHRLRIGGTDEDSGPYDACYIGSYGSFEDYTLIVTEAPSCFTPSALTGVGYADGTALFSWMAPEYGDAPVGYEYTVSTSSSMPTGSGTPVTGTTTTYTGITAGVNYYFFVRTDCGSGSYGDWVASQAFSYILGDTCQSAISLDAQTSPYSNITTGLNNNFTPSCPYMSTAPDMYLSVTVPAGYTITMSQTNNFDSTVSVFYGSCNALTQITCFDDPDETVVNWTNTTGTSQTLYWIEDGYASAAGTFVLSWSFAAPVCYNWTGTVSTTWTDAANWCGSVVPTSADDVVIADTANNPVIASGVAYAHNLTLGAGAT
ncbi:fibronectin type III domain-containing protein, partial [Flavobacterium sp. RHBU_3]|uniref:fibronectin type III domain-containing protein n=1 Tax=Flavobacterium sp. RHBU_3 TaxID=3391184 RepID=UPI0039847788